ncbi:MAG TPA: response regulator [Bacteroidia bacterium]|nr:response regulator [Bacteroidia bacterium]
MVRTKTILLIEDDYLDVKSVKRALEKLKVNHELHVTHNGVDALALLNGNSPGGIKVLPDIILLDLNMPKMNGLEFLGIIKNYYSLKNIKIFVMTTSAEEYDMVTTQSLGVAGYILKPLDFETRRKDNFAKAVLDLKEELGGDTRQLFVPLALVPGAKAHAALKMKALNLKKVVLIKLNQLVLLKVVVIGVAVSTGVGTIVYRERTQATRPLTKTRLKKPVVPQEMPVLLKQDTTATAHLPATLPEKTKSAVEPIVEAYVEAEVIETPVALFAATSKTFKVMVEPLDEDVEQSNTEADSIPAGR